MTDDQVAKLARVTVVVLGLISLVLAIYKPTTLVGLLLTGYAGVTQFFPGVVLGLYWKRVTMPGVFAGMIAGVVIVIFLMLSHRDPLYGWGKPTATLEHPLVCPVAPGSPPVFAS
jgi:SSS family solute:Na+ symporter